MGPFELNDMIGHDRHFRRDPLGVAGVLPRSAFFSRTLIQQELFDAGFVTAAKGGRASTLCEGAVQSRAADRAPKTPPADHVFGESDLAEALVERLSTVACRSGAPRLRRPKGAPWGGRIAETAFAKLYSTDGRSATQRRCRDRRCQHRVIDLASTHSKATRLAVRLPSVRAGRRCVRHRLCRRPALRDAFPRCAGTGRHAHGCHAGQRTADAGQPGRVHRKGRRPAMRLASTIRRGRGQGR
jgi:hypothetical protein